MNGGKQHRVFRPFGLRKLRFAIHHVVHVAHELVKSLKAACLKGARIFVKTVEIAAAAQMSALVLLGTRQRKNGVLPIKITQQLVHGQGSRLFAISAQTGQEIDDFRIQISVPCATLRGIFQRLVKRKRSVSQRTDLDHFLQRKAKEG